MSEQQIDWNGSFDYRALCPTCGQPKGKLSEEPLEGYTTCPTCKRLSLKIETPETEPTDDLVWAGSAHGWLPASDLPRYTTIPGGFVY